MPATITGGAAIANDAENNSPTGRGFPLRKRRLESEDTIDSPADMTNKRMKEEPETSFRSQADWIRNLDKNFVDVICGGKAV